MDRFNYSLCGCDRDRPPLMTYRGPAHQTYQRQEDPGDGVYMFVKFPTNNGTAVGVVRQTVVLARKAYQNVGGRFVGIARKIWDMNPQHKVWNDEAIVVFWFRTIDDARTFFVSDFRMKQPDFPAPAGVCEAWAVVRFYTPPNEFDFSTFMLCEARLKSTTRYEDYKEKFARRFAHLLVDYDAQPFVVQSAGVELLRRYHKPLDTLITVHLFRDPAHLAKIRRDSCWDELMSLQRDMTRDYDFSVFTIDPRACP